MMFCWHCGERLPELPFGKLPFRAECEKCGASLHCCINCRFYKPGLPNDCAVPGTDFIRDREAMNLCEEFKALGQPPSNKEGDRKKFDNLFKDD